MEYQRYIIPDEIFVEIFCGVVSTAIQPSNIPRTAFKGDPYMRNGRFVLRCNTTTQLRLVCRRWDQIIICNPWFWSQICIGISSSEYSRRPPPRLVEKWLERSGAHALDISLTFVDSFHATFEREIDIEKSVNDQMATLSRNSGKLFHWRTKFPKWLTGHIELPTYKSLLHSDSNHQNLTHFMTKYYDRMYHGSSHQRQEYSRRFLWNALAQGYYIFNIWPTLKQTTSRWRSLALVCETNVMITFFHPIFCEARELSELLLDLRHRPTNPITELPRLFESIPPILRLSLWLNFHGGPYPEWFGVSYNRIPRTSLRTITHLQVTDNLTPKEALALMGGCESATFIKIGYVAAGFPVLSTPSQLSSRLRLSALTTLILSISWLVHLVLDHLDLPNLRILQITVPKWLNCASTMLVSSLIASITTINSLQILHINHDCLSFHGVLQLLSDKKIQLIPVLEIGPLFLEQIDSPPISEERALQEILSIAPSFNRCLLVDEKEIYPGSRTHAFGWVEEKVVEEWEDDLREGRVQLSIVDTYRCRKASQA